MINPTDQCGYIHEPEEWTPVVDSATSRLPRERWECPHEAVDGRDHCVFHLSAEDRGVADITDEDIAERFQLAVSADTERSSEFLGATFPELDLEETRIASADDSVIDLRCCTFTDKLNLEKATINSDIRFAGSRFRNRCEFRGASFAGMVDFHGCDFNGVFELPQVTFEGQALFARTDFSFSAYFRDGIEFKSDAVWGGPRDDAEFVVEELLAESDESTDRTLDEFAAGADD